MYNIAYLIDKSHMDYFKIMELPYAVFHSLLMQFQIMDMQKTEEGREILKQYRLLSNPQTEPDWNRIRGAGGYRQEYKKA